MFLCVEDLCFSNILSKSDLYKYYCHRFSLGKCSSCMVEVFREKFWRLGDKVLSLPSDSKTNNQTEL